MDVKQFVKEYKTPLIILGVLILAAIATYVILKMMEGQVFKRPTGAKITSPFGNRVHPVTGITSFHNGIDLGSPTNTPITAPLDGKVISIYENSVGGKQVIILHANGYTTGYAHLNEFNVKEDEQLMQGDVIGWVGSTGQVTGAHLHFTLKKGTQYLDPSLYFDKPL
jgi:murein DD-endopeptidase MepM/ murein hydrolase activator NlpD